MNFSWNFSNWKTALGGFSTPDLEKIVSIDGSVLRIQLRKEKFGGMVTFKFSSRSSTDYYSMSIDQLKDVRAAIDDVLSEQDDSDPKQ